MPAPMVFSQGELQGTRSWTQPEWNGGKTFLYLEGTWEVNHADDTVSSWNHKLGPMQDPE